MHYIWMHSFIIRRYCRVKYEVVSYLIELSTVLRVSFSARRLLPLLQWQRLLALQVVYLICTF